MKSLNKLSNAGFGCVNQNSPVPAPHAGAVNLRRAPVRAPGAHPVPADLDLSNLFCFSPSITVLAQVQNWTLSWPGNIDCTLVMSIGSVQIATNRDYLPPEIEDGSWVVAKLMLARDTSRSPARLLSARLLRLQRGGPTTAWWPIADCEREAHLRRLRHLLSKLEPALQAIFMAVLAKKDVQHKFFNRIAALDHHLYPGGMFDQSVHAGEEVYRRKFLDPRNRQIATLAALLYDIGKVSDDSIQADQPRLGLGLKAHAQTAGHLRHVLNHVARHEPALVATLRGLLEPGDWIEWLSPAGLPFTLKQHMQQALQKSWRVKPAPGDVSKSGAAA